ncbi:MAG: DUF4214 domain-containing protein [Actinomycetota bacterium]
MRTKLRSLLALLLLASVVTVTGSPTAGADDVGGEVATEPPTVAVSGCSISTPSSDFSKKVQLSTGHARVWRLYQAFFLRQPDDAGFDYWLRVRSGGATLADIAYQFSQGNEFVNRYGSLSHAEFVDLAYANILCRTPDAEGRAYWTGLLQSGELTRWDMIINFTELREYLGRTQTCHSIYPAESAATSGCAQSNLRPLSEATFSQDGYHAVTITVPRWGGGSGTFHGVKVDLSKGVFETGSNRCSVASINGNWMPTSEKDGANPSVLGIGVVDGIHVKGSSDRSDRGVFGLRFDPDPTNVVEVWPGDTLSDDDTKLSSVAWHDGKASLENWYAAAELSPYLSELAPQEIVDPSEWVWAAAGIPLRVDGQTDKDFSSADYPNDPYTYQTLGHPFVAVDQDNGYLLFGATANFDVRDMVVWAENNGYEDLVKFDGGGSVEYNVAGQAVVRGTSRDVPVWLGIGC